MSLENKQTVGVKKIYQVDQHTLGIDWTDGLSHRWRLSHLRKNCPCAECVDEWSRERTLDVDAVDDNIAATRVESVGRYAIRIAFSDGHDTGLFTYELLRQLALAVSPQ